MFIPYEKFGNLINKICKNEKIKTYFYKKKVEQNSYYIKNNKIKVLEKLNNKLKKNEKINIVFYIYDETKWKCQSIYDEFNSDNRFSVKILVTKSAAANPNNPSYQNTDDILKTYTFFKKKNLNVEIAYDLEKNRFIPLKYFNPDVIFYQHPWYVETSQGPVVCSKYALTFYVPYYYPIETDKVDYYLRFHQYVEYYCVLNNYTKNKYQSLMDNKGENLYITGYPHLDYFINNSNQNEGYIIYAPHWTVANQGLAYSTFEWSGEFLLEYAKKSNLKWIFKPHPMLHKALIDNKLMTKEEADKYYDDWAKIGIKYEGGDYLELFNKSSMMITDSSSFLGEYFATQKPLIHLMSKNSQFRNSSNPILKTFYRAENLEELKDYIKDLPQKDYKDEIRKQIKKDLNENENYSAKIIKEILLNEIIKNK